MTTNQETPQTTSLEPVVLAVPAENETTTTTHVLVEAAVPIVVTPPVPASIPEPVPAPTPTPPVAPPPVPEKPPVPLTPRQLLIVKIKKSIFRVIRLFMISSFMIVLVWFFRFPSDFTLQNAMEYYNDGYISEPSEIPLPIPVRAYTWRENDEKSWPIVHSRMNYLKLVSKGWDLVVACEYGISLQAAYLPALDLAFVNPKVVRSSPFDYTCESERDDKTKFRFRGVSSLVLRWTDPNRVHHEREFQKKYACLILRFLDTCQLIPSLVRVD